LAYRGTKNTINYVYGNKSRQVISNSFLMLLPMAPSGNESHPEILSDNGRKDLDFTSWAPLPWLLDGESR